MNSLVSSDCLTRRKQNIFLEPNRHRPSVASSSNHMSCCYSKPLSSGYGWAKQNVLTGKPSSAVPQNIQTCFHSLHCPKTQQIPQRLYENITAQKTALFFLFFCASQNKERFETTWGWVNDNKNIFAWTMPLKGQRQINQLAWSPLGLLCKWHSGNPDTRPLKSNTPALWFIVLSFPLTSIFYPFFPPLLRLRPL